VVAEEGLAKVAVAWTADLRPRGRSGCCRPAARRPSPTPCNRHTGRQGHTFVRPGGFTTGALFRRPRSGCVTVKERG